MRRLRDFQPVVLHAGDEGVAGRVVALQDGEAVILLDAPEVLELDGTPQRATLSFTPGIHPVGLAGYADIGPLEGTARFTVVDPTSRPEPRSAPRMPLEVPAIVKPAGSPLPVVARTVDVSCGGLLLAGWRAPEGSAATVLLTLPGSDQRLSFEARVVRCDARGTGVAFGDASSELASFVLHCRRVLAERLAARTAA